MKKLKTISLVILGSILLTGCDLFNDETEELSIYSAPEDASIISSNEAELVLDIASYNFLDISSASSTSTYYYDDTSLYSGSLSNYATSTSSSVTTDITVYTDDVFEVFTDVSNASSINEIYSSNYQTNSLYFIDDYEEYDEESSSYITLYRIVYIYEDNEDGVESSETGIATSSYDNYDNAQLAFIEYAGDIMVSASKLSTSLSSVDYFDASNLLNRNSNGFTRSGDTIYFTYYSVSRSTISNIIYPNDSTKAISSFTVSNYQIIYELINDSYYLTSVKSVNYTYVTNNFYEEEFSSPYIIESNTCETTFTYGEEVTYGTSLSYSYERGVTAYAIITRPNSSTTSTYTLSDYTSAYKNIYDTTFSGIALYTTFTVYYESSTLSVNVNYINSDGSEHSTAALNTYNSVDSIDDRFNKITTNDDGEIVLGTGTYSAWIIGTLDNRFNTYFFALNLSFLY